MSIANALAKALKKGGVASDAVEDNGLFLSTGVPNVDRALNGKYRGGGFKSSRIHEIASPGSVGKTLLAQHVIKAAQEAGGAGAFHDHERTFIPALFERYGGSIEDGIWTYRRPRSLEESFDQSIDWMSTIRKADVIPFEAPLVCVFDSLAAMVPAAKLAERKPGESLNMREKLALATATSQELPAFNQFVSENNICAIFLNQMRLKPGVTHGDPRYTPGGEAMFFYDATKMYLGRTVNRGTKGDDKGQVTGQTIRLETVKNKTFRPFQKTEFEFKFNPDGTGYIDVVDTMLTHLKQVGKIEMSGSYMVWEGKKLYQSQLLERLKGETGIVDRLVDMAVHGTQVGAVEELNDGAEVDVDQALAGIADLAA